MSTVLECVGRSQSSVYEIDAGQIKGLQERFNAGVEFFAVLFRKIGVKPVADFDFDVGGDVRRASP